MTELLPGLDDDITLNRISPKLPWVTFQTLARVSDHGWRRAIRSRQVYDARVRSESTETLAVISIFSDRDGHKIGLYSMRDNSCYELPPLFRSRLIPQFSQCISLDGKLYILGGQKHPSAHGQSHSDSGGEVYVLDLAGQRNWTECASMTTPRQRFGCGVINGKIYVFGGISARGCVQESEVYDPKADAWSPLTPTTFGHTYPDVATIGEELFVHGRDFYGRHNRFLHDSCSRHTSFMDAYHPGKQEWRQVIKEFGQPSCAPIFVANGKFHSITRSDIWVHDIETNSWKRLHTNSFAANFDNAPIGPGTVMDIYSTLAVNDELLLFADWRNEDKSSDEGLLRSEGFSRENIEIVWQKVNWSFPAGCIFSPPFMCPIEL